MHSLSLVSFYKYLYNFSKVSILTSRIWNCGTQVFSLTLDKMNHFSTYLTVSAPCRKMLKYTYVLVNAT